jgi:hypothetical protein
MVRRFIAVVSAVVVVVAVAMVIVALRSPAGAASALGVWGFILTALGVVLGAVSLWLNGPELGPGDVQNVTAQQGDAFGVQGGGDLRMNRLAPRRAEESGDQE